jgi:hypothetical protein
MVVINVEETQEVKTVDFRDAGSVYLTDVKRPTFLYDRETKIRLKYGEFSDVEVIYMLWRDAYISKGFLVIADDLAMIEVAPDQEQIDELFQSSGAFAIFVTKLQNISDSYIHRTQQESQ